MLATRRPRPRLGLEGGVDEARQGVRLSDEQRLDWLRLIRSQNVGPRTFRTLVNHFGGARAALEALPALARRGGAGGAPQICSRADAEREIRSGRESLASRSWRLGEPGYPPRLQMIDDAPPLLAVRGLTARRSRLPMVADRRFAQRLRRRDEIHRNASPRSLARPASPLSPASRAASTPPPIAASLATGTIAVLAGGHDRALSA